MEKRILVLVDTFDEYCQSEIFDGILNAAQKRDINIITLPLAFQGKYDHVYTHYFFIKEFLKSRYFDAIISFTGGLSEHTSLMILRALFSNTDLPIISVAGELNRDCDVLIDNKPGIIEVIDHLVKKHNTENIAFVGGPEINAEAKERLTAYKMGLLKNGIHYNESLVFDGTYSEESGMKAVRTLLKNSIHFDSLIGADDCTARGAMKELLKNNINVPENVKIVGFDDTEEAFLSSPSLTTIKQPFFEIGRKALELADKAASGEVIEKKVIFNTRAVFRESCSCYTDEVILFLRNNQEIHKKLKYVSWCDEKMYLDIIEPAIHSALDIYPITSEKENYETFLQMHLAFLWNSYRLAEKDQANCEAFLLTFTGILNNQAEYYEDYSVWEYALTFFTSTVEKLVDNTILHNALNDMLRIAHAIYEKHLGRTTMQEHLQFKQQNIILHGFMQHIIHCKTVPELYRTLQYECERFKFPYFIMTLFNHPSSKDHADKSSRVYTIVSDGASSGARGIEFHSSRITSSDFIKPHLMENSIWLPLTFKDIYYGYLMLPVEEEYPKYLYEEIRNHISLSLSFLY